MPASFLVVAADNNDFYVFETHLNRLGHKAVKSLRRKGNYPAFDPKSHQGLVILGDGHELFVKNHLGERFRNPRFKKERTDITTAFAHDKAILGICHGYQLLADEFECDKPDLFKDRLTDWEMGEIDLLPEGKKDPVLAPLMNDPRVFQEHWYTFPPPPKGTSLANSQNQVRPHCEAYRIGDRIYGLQFHPEVTEESYSWGNEETGWKPRDLDPQLIREVTEKGHRVIEAWVKLTLLLR